MEPELKRFFDTCLWDQEWFTLLSPIEKCLWQYIHAKCDNAGIWEPNWTLAKVVISAEVNESTLNVFGERIARLRNGKFFLVSFVIFQCGKLSAECPPHNAIIASLERNGVDPNLLPLGYPKATLVLENKEKEKEKDFGKGSAEGKPRWAAPTVEECSGFSKEIGLPETEAIRFRLFYESNGWKVGKNPMKSWKSSMQHWKLTHEERGKNGYNQTHKRGNDARPNRNAGTFNEGLASSYTSENIKRAQALRDAAEQNP